MKFHCIEQKTATTATTKVNKSGNNNKRMQQKWDVTKQSPKAALTLIDWKWHLRVTMRERERVCVERVFDWFTPIISGNSDTAIQCDNASHDTTMHKSGCDDKADHAKKYTLDSIFNNDYGILYNGFSRLIEATFSTKCSNFLWRFWKLLSFGKIPIFASYMMKIYHYKTENFRRKWNESLATCWSLSGWYWLSFFIR